MTSSPNRSRASQPVQNPPSTTSVSSFNLGSIPADKVNGLERLLTWSAENDGYVHPDIGFAYHPEKGYHACVIEDREIKSQTRIASAPMTTTLSVLNALNVEPFGNHGTVFPREFLHDHQHKPEILQTFFLMEQSVIEEKSWWAPYIRTLPTVKDVFDLDFEREEDLRWIRGTNVETAMALQNQKWKEQFDAGIGQLASLEWPHAINGKYTWELYKWAATMYGSRSFTSQVLTDTTAYDRARPMSSNDPDHHMLSKLFSDRFAVLLPVLDILNHKPGALVEWQARHGFVGLQMLNDYESGQELFNNYGPRDNEGLFLAYGFVIDDNPFDHITIQIQVPPGSPLQDSRSWPKDERSNEDFRGFIFDYRNPIFKEAPYLERAPFSYDLLDSVSVLLANDRELQNMYASERSLMSSSLGETFPDFRNLLATISQMMQDCKARLRRVVDTDPLQTDSQLQPVTQKQKYARIYRKNQIKILHAAIAACALVLLHAGTKQTVSDLLSSAQVKLPQHFVEEYHETFRNSHFLTQQHELLTAGGLISILPSSMSRTIQKCMSDVEKQLDKSNSSIEYVDLIKSTFAICFAAMSVEMEAGGGLPSRLKHWMEQTISLYPPQDETWSYVPSEGPYAPGDEPPPTQMKILRATSQIIRRLSPTVKLRRWLQPKRICWGWNVMEEEGVRVPGEIEAFLSDDPGRITELMGFLIYCKQQP